MDYVYIRSEPGLYTVGFYDPAGKWQAESDHSSAVSAAARVAFLNGGGHGCKTCGELPDATSTLRRIVGCDLSTVPAESNQRLLNAIADAHDLLAS